MIGHFLRLDAQTRLSYRTPPSPHTTKSSGHLSLSCGGRVTVRKLSPFERPQIFFPADKYYELILAIGSAVLQPAKV